MLKMVGTRLPALDHAPQLPFLRNYINCIWVGNWTAVTYTCLMYAVLMFHKKKDDVAFQRDMVMVGAAQPRAKRRTDVGLALVRGFG